MGQQKSLGHRGEQHAAEHIQQHGWHILAHNYHCRGGEIDIIGKKENTISFIEVKARTKRYFPHSQVITPQKQKHIIYAARNYIAQEQLRNCVLRFDVAIIIYKSMTPEISYIANAFAPPDGVIL
jgi:putative endonuclease